MIEADAHGIEITEGEAVAFIPPTAAVPATPKALPEVRPAPATAVHIDVDTGELAAPLGTVEHLASSTLALARAFGGLTVATAEFATDDPSPRSRSPPRRRAGRAGRRRRAIRAVNVAEQPSDSQRSA